MRFAYIDSQGNEVSIPSVDALALRIELGAIGPETELYDAQADRWGPAESHEIFHSLSRDVAGEGYLVPAPPPPPAEDEPPPAEDETAGPPADDLPPPPVDPPLSHESLGLTLAPEPEGPSGEAEAESAAEQADDAGFGSFEFSLVEPELPGTGPGEASGAPQSPSPWSDAEPLIESDAPGGAEASDGAAEDEAGPGFAGGFGDGGFELESPMEFASGEGGGAEPIEVDGPMPTFEPSGPPAWMEQDGPAGAEPSMDFSKPADAPAESSRDAHTPAHPAAPPARDRPTPRQAPRRPAPRRARRAGGGGRLLFGLLVLGAVAAGGYYGWDRFGDRLRPEPPRPPVTIPAIPPELEPPMRDLADAAIPAMFEEIEAGTLGEDFPGEPSEDWLAGVYLANASRFGQVEAFWSGIGRFAERLEALEVETFHARYRALADSADMEEADRDLIVERADSGFLATRDERVRSYRMLGRIAGAALVLHEFLVENEQAIAYTPATAFSGNPVEEAVPATDELGDRMWDLVEDITSAMDALGTLDRVTRERLSGVVLRRVTEIGIE